MAQALVVGTAANLLFGYKAAWDPSGTEAQPFFSPAVAPLEPQTPVTRASNFTLWDSTPVITLHESAQSLLSAVYRYEVMPPANDPRAIDVPSGPLALDDADGAAALKAAGDFLGLDLSAGGRFMLVSYERTTKTSVGDYTDGGAARARASYLTPAAQKTVNALTPAAAPEKGEVLYQSRLTLADAQAYMAAINTLGTHFVTEVTYGDKLVQVFAYGADDFKYLQTQFQQAAQKQPDGSMAVTGVLANSWKVYTSPKSTGGLVAGYGGLAAMSRDPALAKAIAAGHWASGYVPDGTPSIFAAAENYNLLQALTEEVTYACRLAPMSALLPDALVQAPWERMVAGGLLQKFGDAVRLPLARPVDYQWSDIFPQAVESWASGIVTPEIDIYQERVDLAQVKLMGAEIIGEAYKMQSFTCFAQVLQATTAEGAPPIALPSDDVTLVAQIIDTTQAEQTPVLMMSDKAMAAKTISCETMYGALVFQKGNGGAPDRQTAVDGFLMDTGLTTDPATGRWEVQLAGVLTEAPGEAVLAAHGQSVEFSLVAGETLLNAQGKNAAVVKGLERAYLDWLAEIIPDDTTDETLANARVRALYLSNSVATFGADSVFVPYVTYDSYSKYVGDLTNQAVQLSGQITSYQSQLMTTVASFKALDSIENVNKNVQAIGGVLTQYFAALAKGRAAMDSYYDNILSQLDSQLQSTLKDISKLQGQLKEQQLKISNLGAPPGIIQKFEQDYVDYERDEIFKAVMGIVSGLFDVGLAFAGIPGAADKGVLDALKALKTVYDKLQAVMTVIKQLSVIEKTVKNISKINELASTIQTAAQKGTLEMPSVADLEMIPNNVEAALAGVPQNGKLQQDKADLIAAVRNLVIVGTAMLNAQTEASRLLVEIANNSRRKQINAQQQADMSGLTNALHLNSGSVPPDLAKVDLIGMTGQLQFQLKQVLSTLARTLSLQNGALQFTYFGQPAEITSFSLNELMAVISTQDANILNAIEKLNPQPQKVPQPITVKIDSVPYKQLINGNFKRVTVHANDPGFQNYVMVRIDRVVPKIKGIKSTTGGNYEIALDTDARPFIDRDLERETRTFFSTRRSFGPFVYEVATGKAEFGTGVGTFADKVTHITPFANWNISLPNTGTNAGIAFDELLVDIELEFHVTAIYNSPVEQVRATLQRQVMARTMNAFALPDAMPNTMLAAPELMEMAAAAVPNDKPSLSYLEGQMYQNQAVLNGWDAAFSMLSGPVNAFLNAQFLNYIKTLNPGNKAEHMTVKASYFGTPTPMHFHGQTFWTATATEIEIELTEPLLQFVANADQATVQQYIKAGQVKVGSVDVAFAADGKSSPFLPKEAFLLDKPVSFTVDTKTNELVIPQKDVLGPHLGSIYLSTTGTLPAPLKAGDPTTGANEYFVLGWKSTGDETRITLSADATGTTPVDLTDAGSGTQTLTLGVTWNAPAKVVTDKNPYVFANVQLSMLKGIVEPPAGQGDASDTLTVTLDFPSGSFLLRNIHVEPANWDPNPDATQISDAIANYFAQNDIKYHVQTLNTKDLAADTDLTPTKFVLHAMNTNAGNNVLQLLIATTGKVQNAHSLNLTEPVAYDPANPVAGQSDFSVSLMISSALTFKHIFVDSFNKGGTGFQVAAQAPGQDFQAWSAKMTSGTVTADVPFHKSYTIRGKETQFRISASGNSMSWDMTGMTFTRSEGGGVDMAYSNGDPSVPTGGVTKPFQYRTYEYAPGSEYSAGYWYWTDWQDSSAVIYVNMTGSYPLQVVNSGANQLVQFSDTNPDVHVEKSSDLKPTKACHCDDNDIKIALVQALADAVPGQIRKNMDQITFKPVSIMALESLLFPAEQLISMGTARVPSGTLVVGNFLPQVRKKASKYNVTIPAASGGKGEFGGTAFQSGGKTPSVTVSNLPAQFTFKYGPVDPTIGNQVEYTINIETGTVSPETLMVTVMQPDPTNHPENVTLLLPGFPISGAAPKVAAMANVALQQRSVADMRREHQAAIDAMRREEKGE